MPALETEGALKPENENEDADEKEEKQEENPQDEIQKEEIIGE